MSISYIRPVRNIARFVVIPAGVEFFHITERATGRVMGFRRSHLAACELARSLDL
ncbi:hypothetical protein ACTWM0_19655 [Pseudomonas machongensis]|uniref:hypothetical protein n=1 Tax=unclassified Pseudomonas TaxID=196821 RepID=UPI0012E13121|nr:MULTISPECIES: hypothetical protein [unclassified Pseudomonas]